MNIFYKQFRKDTNSNITLDFKNPLEELKNEFKDCSNCTLCKTRIENRSIVFGNGMVRPRVMFIGGFPSNYDSELGIPFSDKAGEKLKGIIEYLNRKISLINNTYITNLILCPGNITEESIKACRNRLEREIKLVSPKVICFLGLDVAKTFIKTAQRQTSMLVKLDKYYTSIATHSILDLLYKNEEVRKEIGIDMDFLIKVIKDEERTVT